MGYRRLTAGEQERFALAGERLAALTAEQELPEALQQFFAWEASFLLDMEKLRQELCRGQWADAPEAELEKRNRRLYGELTEERYANGWGSPVRLASLFGREGGAVLSVLYAELRGAVAYAFADRPWDMLILQELLLQMYCLCRDSRETEGRWKALREAMYWYAADYDREVTEERVRELLDPSLSLLREQIMTADLTDLRYLYGFGEYVTDAERRMAASLNALSEDEAEQLARSRTEAYLRSLPAEYRDGTRHGTVDIRARLGTERIIRHAVRQFAGMGLQAVLHRPAPHIFSGTADAFAGWHGAVPNRQYVPDHRNDAALWLDERFVTRALQDLQEAYETCRGMAAAQAGSVCLDASESICVPSADGTCLLQLTEEQQRLQTRLAQAAEQIAGRYAGPAWRTHPVMDRERARH